MKPATTIAQAKARRDAALKGARTRWARKAYAFISEYAQTHGQVFCDDIWKAGLKPPRDARALGSVITKLAKDGVLQKTGLYRPSVHSNLTAKPVWSSPAFYRNEVKKFCKGGGDLAMNLAA